MRRVQSIILDGLVYCKDLKCLLQLSEPDYTALLNSILPHTAKDMEKQSHWDQTAFQLRIFNNRTKWSHIDTLQGYGPSWMQISTVLNHRHVTCVLWQIFLCSVTCFIPFYSISLCFLNPCKCLEHAIPLTILPRKHLPLFWTWHILALLVASDICWETSWNCSPFPFELIIFTAQFSHSRDGKSSFI